MYSTNIYQNRCLHRNKLLLFSSSLEPWRLVVERLGVEEIKLIRLVCRGLRDVSSHLLIRKAYFALQYKTTNILMRLAESPVFSRSIETLVIDTTFFRHPAQERYNLPGPHSYHRNHPDWRDQPAQAQRLYVQQGHLLVSASFIIGRALLRFWNCKTIVLMDYSRIRRDHYVDPHSMPQICREGGTFTGNNKYYDRPIWFSARPRAVGRSLPGDLHGSDERYLELVNIVLDTLVENQKWEDRTWDFRLLDPVLTEQGAWPIPLELLHPRSVKHALWHQLFRTLRVFTISFWPPDFENVDNLHNLLLRATVLEELELTSLVPLNINPLRPLPDQMAMRLGDAQWPYLRRICLRQWAFNFEAFRAFLQNHAGALEEIVFEGLFVHSCNVTEGVGALKYLVDLNGIVLDNVAFCERADRVVPVRDPGYWENFILGNKRNSLRHGQGRELKRGVGQPVRIFTDV